MSKAKKILSLDDRGRITLPPELRENVESFSVQTTAEGVLQLVPQKSVSMKDAKLLDALKGSINEVLGGKTVTVPEEWIDE